MSFLHPEFLYLAPLLALPVIIHFLNRIRYRRVRWAAIDFLLTSERRAVRRARLRQILLMALRVLLLSAALGALLQPILRGSVAGFLGSSSQLAIVLDGSASMSARANSGLRPGEAGSAFDHARELASEALSSLPANARATCGTFAARWESPFREPLQDRRALRALIASLERSDGAGNVPRAIRSAAEALARGGGGGTIWILTDSQASGWKPADTGAWQEARKALADAGSPRVVVTSVAANVESNFSIPRVRTTPAVLVEGDAPKLTVTVELHARPVKPPAIASGGVTSVGLFLEGRRVDSRVVKFDAPGKVEVVFRLPSLKTGTHAGLVELSADALSADDRSWFVLRVTDRRPILVVDGSPSSVPFEGAADFLALALQPPETDASARSPFSVKRVSLQQLPGTSLADSAAVILADAARLDPATVEQLRRYLEGGGLVMIFPGPHTDVAAWNACGFPGVPVSGLVEAEPDKPIKVNWVLPTDPVTSPLPTEGLDRLTIKRLFRFDKSGAGSSQVLATTEAGDPFLVRRQVGKGKVYVFGVSAQADSSNFPFTPVLLLTVHRAILAHALEIGEPPASAAYSVIQLQSPPGRHHILTPDGKLLPTTSAEGASGPAVFSETRIAGIYRLVEGDAAPADPQSAPAVAAITVAPEESSLETIDAETLSSVSSLLGAPVHFLPAEGDTGDLGATGGARSAMSGFPLAALALTLLLGEVVLAWTMDRPSRKSDEATKP